MSEMIRVLMADNDTDFQQEVQKYWKLEEDLCCVGKVASSEDVTGKIQATKPHVLLLNVLLPPEGGLAVLKNVRKMWDSNQLSIILISGSETEALLRRASELGADYYLMKPFELGVLTERIKLLLRNSSYPSAVKCEAKDVKEVCIRYFDLMGIPPHYKGYRYLLEGIWLACIHPHWMNAVTRKLYPAIGQRFNTSGAQVERAMRYALDVTWERGNMKYLYKFFPYEVTEAKGKPTNSAFIAKIAGLVTLELGS